MFKLFSSKLYPYLITIAVSIYIATQFLSIASASNIGVTLEEVATKQKVVFDFLMTQSLEIATKTSKVPNILEAVQKDKDELMTFLAYNKSITVYDVSVFDVNGNLLSENTENITSFSSLFKNINPLTIIEPTIVNIRYSETYSDYVMDILVPITEQGKITGIMWQVESFERINSAMSDASVLQTGEFYIIDEKGQLLTKLNDVDNLSPLIVHNSKIVDNRFDGFEKDSYLNYDNVSVYGYHLALPLNNWTLIVEVNESEVLNTLANVNSFMLRGGTLILACSKLLEPLSKKRQANKLNVMQLNKELIQLKDCEKENTRQSFICYVYFIKNIYQRFCHHINIALLLLFTILSVFIIGSNQIDQSIQTNLDLANRVNTKLVSYYLDEQKSRFNFSTRTYNEYISTNSSLDGYLKFCLDTNNNFLNLIILDPNQNIIASGKKSGINLNYATDAINSQNSIMNTIGTSDIFYDENYKEYVMYFSAAWYSNDSESSYQCIGVVSINHLTDLITTHELQGSRIFSILNNEKIMYSNTYTASEIPYKHYTYLKKQFTNRSINSYSVHSIKKYPNSLGEEVFGSYEHIKPNDLMLYASYNSINNTNWQLLYEEPVKDARKQLIEGIYNLLYEIVSEYIRNTVNNLR